MSSCPEKQHFCECFWCFFSRNSKPQLSRLPMTQPLAMRRPGQTKQHHEKHSGTTALRPPQVAETQHGLQETLQRLQVNDWECPASTPGWTSALRQKADRRFALVFVHVTKTELKWSRRWPPSSGSAGHFGWFSCQSLWRTRQRTAPALNPPLSRETKTQWSMQAAVWADVPSESQLHFSLLLTGRNLCLIRTRKLDTKYTNVPVINRIVRSGVIEPFPPRIKSL